MVKSNVNLHWSAFPLPVRNGDCKISFIRSVCTEREIMATSGSKSYLQRVINAGNYKERYRGRRSAIFICPWISSFPPMRAVVAMPSFKTSGALETKAEAPSSVKIVRFRLLQILGF